MNLKQTIVIASLVLFLASCSTFEYEENSFEAKTNINGNEVEIQGEVETSENEVNAQAEVEINDESYEVDVSFEKETEETENPNEQEFELYLIEKNNHIVLEWEIDDDSKVQWYKIMHSTTNDDVKYPNDNAISVYNKGDNLRYEDWYNFKEGKNYYRVSAVLEDDSVVHSNIEDIYMDFDGKDKEEYKEEDYSKEDSSKDAFSAITLEYLIESTSGVQIKNSNSPKTEVESIKIDEQSCSFSSGIKLESNSDTTITVSDCDITSGKSHYVEVAHSNGKLSQSMVAIK